MSKLVGAGCWVLVLVRVAWVRYGLKMVEMYLSVVEGPTKTNLIII